MYRNKKKGTQPNCIEVKMKLKACVQRKKDTRQNCIADFTLCLLAKLKKTWVMGKFSIPIYKQIICINTTLPQSVKYAQLNYTISYIHFENTFSK